VFNNQEYTSYLLMGQEIICIVFYAKSDSRIIILFLTFVEYLKS
jgi:hypothetical protein